MKEMGEKINYVRKERENELYTVDINILHSSQCTKQTYVLLA